MASTPSAREAIYLNGLNSGTGVVVHWVKSGRGWGFARTSAPVDLEVFLHGSEMPDDERESVTVGSVLMFDLDPFDPRDGRKPRAINVRLVPPQRS